MSAGGADGSAASCALIDAIVSAGWTESVNDAGGLSDLNVTEMGAEEDASRCALRSGGGGTEMGSTGTLLKEYSGGC